MSTLYATNDGVRLAYEVRGDGPPLLMIHGLGYNRPGWGPLPDLLAPDFRLVLFDNRGVNASDSPPGPYTAAQMAADAAAVLDEVGLDRAHVLGTSLGGIVAQELALTYPERVDRLVLVCTHPGVKGFPLPQRTIELFAAFPTLPPEIALRRGAANSLADATVESRPGLVDEVYAYRMANPPPLDGWQAQLEAGSTFDALDRLHEIQAPTLVMHGTADNVVDVRNAELIAERIPNARLELFDGLGHIFFWEEPERFARVVKEFLSP